MKIVIFDMDGTLIDSSKDITISINYIRDRHYSLEPLSDQYIIDVINMHTRNLPMLFYGTETYKDRDRDLFEEHYYEQCIKNTYLYSGIEELLFELKSQNIELSVATNAPSQFASKMLNHLKIGELFDHIVGADMVKVSKPDPQMLKLILDNYGFSRKSDRAWIVGDSSKDIEAGKNIEIDTVFSTWGFSYSGEADHVVRKPSELLEIINKV